MRASGFCSMLRAQAGERRGAAKEKKEKNIRLTWSSSSSPSTRSGRAKNSCIFHGSCVCMCGSSMRRLVRMKRKKEIQHENRDRKIPKRKKQLSADENIREMCMRGGRGLEGR